MRSLGEDFSEWHSNVEDTSRQVHTLLEHWQQYDTMFAQLNSWLNDMEVKVKSVTELKSTLAEKKANCDRYKVSSISNSSVK